MCVCACLIVYSFISRTSRQAKVEVDSVAQLLFSVHLSVFVHMSQCTSSPWSSILHTLFICFSLSSCCLSLFHLLFLSPLEVSALPLSDACYSEQFVYSGLARQKNNNVIAMHEKWLRIIKLFHATYCKGHAWEVQAGYNMFCIRLATWWFVLPDDYELILVLLFWLSLHWIHFWWNTIQTDVIHKTECITRT